ncbi:hypothetical protein MHYP_G00167930 [Metynnis hypsauchen]
MDSVFGFSVWSLAVCVVIVCVLLINTDLFLTKPQQSALDTLASANLRTTTGEVEERSFKALTLWEDTGAVIMAEASELSSLRPQLDAFGVPLYAVVKENIGTEIQTFRAYFNGEIFLDEKGILMEHQEMEFGDTADLRSVLEAVRKVEKAE